MKWVPTLPCGPMGSEWKKLCRLCLINFLASARASWSLVTEDVGPSARSVHAGAWDSSRQRFWVHAGAGEQILKDLWAFDATTNAWTSITAALPWQSGHVGPSERKDHVAVWDPNGALWIHGGFDGTNFVKVAVWDSIHSVLWIHGGYDGNLKSDLWKYDSDWSLIQTPNMPSARAQHVAVWDDARLAIWLHGGYDEQGLCRDLWRFDTATSEWSLMAVDGPTARAYHVAAWDATKLALWIHGGFDGMACEDLWRFDTASSSWVLIYQGGPSARFNHIAAWDVTSASFWLHGGYVENGPLQRDLWRFDVTSTSSSMSTSSTASSSVTTSSSSSTRSTSSSETSSTTVTSSSSSSGTATTTTTRSSSSTSSTSTRSSTSATVTTTTSSTISQSATSSSSTRTTTFSSTLSTTSTLTSTGTSTSSTSATVTTTSTSTISQSTSSSSSTRTKTSSSTLSSTSTQTSTGTSTSSTSATITATTSTTTSQSTSSSTRSRTLTSSSTSATLTTTTSSTTTTSTQTSTGTSTSSTSATATTTTSTTTSQSTSSSTRSRTTTSSSTLSKTSTQTSTGTSTSSTSVTVSRTSSSSQSSTGTVSTSSTFSITETTSSFTTSSKTLTTATTSTSTSTLGALRAEDLTLLMILCPIMGVLVLGLSIMVVVMACWARKRRRRFVIPTSPAPPPPPCPPPEPPTVWSLWVTNTQLLQVPAPPPRIARILHHFDPWPLGLLNLPDLTTCIGEVHPRHKELRLPEAPKAPQAPLHLCIDIDLPMPRVEAPGLEPRASPTQSTPALQTPATVAVASKTWLPGTGAVRHAASFRASQKPPRLQRHVVFASEPSFVNLPKKVERGQNGQNGQRAVVVSVQPSPLLNVRSRPTTEAPSVQRSSAFREQERLRCKCFLQRGQPAQTQTLSIFWLPNLPTATRASGASGASQTVERQLPLSEFLPEAPVNSQYRVPHGSVPELQLATQDNRSRHSVASPDVFGKRLISLSLASASSSVTVQICPDPTCLSQKPTEPQWPKSQKPRIPRGITAPPVLQTPAENLGPKGATKCARGSRGQRLRGQRTTSSRERAFYIPSLETER